jgi:hypothetical protein
MGTHRIQSLSTEAEKVLSSFRAKAEMGTHRVQSLSTEAEKVLSGYRAKAEMGTHRVEFLSGEAGDPGRIRDPWRAGDEVRNATITAPVAVQVVQEGSIEINGDVGRCEERLDETLPCGEL